MPSPLELAEDFTLHLPPRMEFLREVRPDWVLTTGNSGASIARIRLAASGVEGAVAEVRARLAREDVSTCTWWCGSRATPPDLPERLAGLGLAPDERDPTVAVLLLDREPGGAPPAVEVRRVDTYEDFVTATEVSMRGWGESEEVQARRRAGLRQSWQTAQEQDAVHYLGYLDGTPVGLGRAFFFDEAGLLLGGAVVPEARGRGVYVALVHARWREAVARGAPALVVQAGAMSRPILERLGFRRIGEIQLMVDRL